MKKTLSVILSLVIMTTFASGAFAKSSKTQKTAKESKQKVEKTQKTSQKSKKAKKTSTARSDKFVSNKEFNNAQGYYEQGKDWDRKNNRPGSHVQFTKALNINPYYDEAKLARAQAFYYNQNYDKSYEDFKYFYNKDEQYGAATFYEYRIDCKLKQGLYAEALDEMYEAILAYGGHTQLLNEMIQIIQQHPELSYKLSTAAHTAAIAKHKNQASVLRDYAQLYKPNEGKVPNEDYYNFYINIAQTMNPNIALEVLPMTPLERSVPDGGVTQTIYQKTK